MITFNANNNKQLTVSQSVHDGDVTVTRGNVMETTGLVTRLHLIGAGHPVPVGRVNQRERTLDVRADERERVLD